MRLVGSQQIVQSQQITPQQSHSQLESQESLVQPATVDDPNDLHSSFSRKQKIKQVNN